MVKQKTNWACAECGHQQPKWSGKCPQCNTWNTLHEELTIPDTQRRFEAQSQSSNRPIRINEVSTLQSPRILTGMHEFDQVLGGGIVPGSLSLIGGDPGIGKSTLLLQISNALAKQGLLVLYICGEESTSQTCLRAHRLGVDSDNLLLLNETDYSLIQKHIEQVNPDIIIVDSIQIVYKREITSAPGSVSQVRETATEFMHLAKGKNIAIFLIGHVTKSGEIAGPRVLEHLVDTVLYFEGDKHYQYRLIRVIKNRFGPTDEIAVFQMLQKGLEEVTNPSQIFLEERHKQVPGSVVIPTIEGSRPILVEVQALVTKTAYSTPSRRATGLDANRLALLLAVLEKRLGYQMYHCDVFVSVAGGIKITEPAIDLGILLAIASSFNNKIINSETTVIGEVGLTGEVRSVPKIESRLKEAAQMGFSKCLLPKRNVQGLPKKLTQSLQLTGLEMVEEVIHAAF